MKSFLTSISRLAAVLSAVFALALLPARPKTAVKVQQIKASQWRQRQPQDSVSVKTRQILEHCCKYALNAWRNDVKHFTQQTGTYYDFGGRQEKHIRPVSHEAFVLAMSLRLGICSPKVTGVGQKEALRFTEKLIASMAWHHKANSGEKGWGDQWQSALWAAQGAEAAWFLWDKLSEQTRNLVLKMLIHEADRFIGYQVPYYQDKEGRIVTPGDTKAEENAWNSNILTIACDMLPRHPHFQQWFEKNRELQISAYARSSDLKRHETVDGVMLSEILQGSNMNEDGTVVNHNRIHPDYMVAFMHNATNVLLDRLARRQPLASSTFNGDIIYQALTNLPFGSEKRTIYCRDGNGQATSKMYFPEGNDWGTGRQANYWLMDVLAHEFRFDRNVRPSAYAWAAARTDTMLEKISQSTSGRYFNSKKENSFDTAEEFFAAQIAWGYLALWLGGK